MNQPATLSSSKFHHFKSPFSHKLQSTLIAFRRLPGSFVASSSINSNPRQKQELLSSKEKMNPERIAVVTGSNRGIGLEISRQLALNGVTVILTARDEKKGNDALNSLKTEPNLSNIIFHQLDVCDSDSAASLAEFIKSRFGKLDILVNNAGVGGVSVDVEGLKALNIDPNIWTSGKAVNMIQEVVIQTYEGAVNCLNTNYYGLKTTTESLLPLLSLSKSGARIVNLSSLRSELNRLPNKKLQNDLRDIDNWDENRLEQEVITKFLKDLKENKLEEAGWPIMLPAYSVSKLAVNAYTRILAKRYPEMRINCVMPGFVNTEINWNTGVLSVKEGAKGPVMLCLVGDEGPSGCYFDETELGVAW
ncbi:hypothetical protein LUZ60_013204 [Juncus effusus]|nr:hypothetical protein LUZ60_013204 [Juncus effusus]